jgi:hypothetical protein
VQPTRRRRATDSHAPGRGFAKALYRLSDKVVISGQLSKLAALDAILRKTASARPRIADLPVFRQKRIGIVGSEAAEGLVASTPLGGRFGRPEEIAPAVIFLASDDAAWLTGERTSASDGVH